MVPAVRAMEDQDQGAAVAAGVAAAATTVAEASPLVAAEDPRSTRRAIAVPALAPKPALSEPLSHLFLVLHKSHVLFPPLFHETMIIL